MRTFNSESIEEINHLINARFVHSYTGANVNHQRQSDGLSALMVAAMQKNNRMASRLVAKGADVFLLDKKGRSAMDYVKKGHNQVSFIAAFYALSILFSPSITSLLTLAKVSAPSTSPLTFSLPLPISSLFPLKSRL